MKQVHPALEAERDAAGKLAAPALRHLRALGLTDREITARFNQTPMLAAANVTDSQLVVFARIATRGSALYSDIHELNGDTSGAVVFDRADWIRERRALRASRCRYRTEARERLYGGLSTTWQRKGVHRFRWVAIAHAWWLDARADGIQEARVIDQQHVTTNNTTPASTALAAEEGTGHDR